MLRYAVGVGLGGMLALAATAGFAQERTGTGTSSQVAQYCVLPPDNPDAHRFYCEHADGWKGTNPRRAASSRAGLPCLRPAECNKLEVEGARRAVVIRSRAAAAWCSLRAVVGNSTMHTDLESDFLVLLYDVARQMRTVTDQMAQEHGSTRAQCIILARLERQPGMSQNELAAIAEVAPITVARLVDRLEEQGLVERCTDPKDRRIWRLRLTPAAAPVLRDVKRYRAEVRELMTQGVNPKDLKTMMMGLHKMKQNLTSRLAEAAE